MQLRTATIGCVCAVAALASVPASSLAKAHHKKHVAPKYYLALGDSLARGAQPNSAGATVPTSKGYANDLYAAEKSKIKGLKLLQLGCLGESTTSMMSGGICKYKGGNQLKAAVRFIKTHKIAFVTLDIGANDVDFCAPGGVIDLKCLSAGVASIGKNVPKIVAALRSAGPDVEMIGMTYYDPFLADYLSGASGQSVAALSVGLAKSVNQTLTTAYTTSKFKVADVATAFDTYVPFTTMVPAPAGGSYSTIPLAVAKICQLTWMCAAKPVGPNIHANALGYTAIANVFAPLV
ncbi:MAG: SGNH/GDSL hydrolase family protein [Solirubrobacteraceae bacterium]